MSENPSGDDDTGEDKMGNFGGQSAELAKLQSEKSLAGRRKFSEEYG